ncbi:MAG: hypothetical protein AAGK21_15640, partial [Bacteroidota bacterium]
MRFRLTCLALGLLPLAAAVGAQPSGLSITGGYAVSAFDGDRLAELGETYSDFYVARLDGPVELLPTGSEAFSVGATARIDAGGMAAAFGVQLGRDAFDVTTRFENGSGDHVTTETSDLAAWTELTLPVGPLAVGGHAGGLFREVRIESATVYADGSESLGSEFRLNGVYTASATSLEVGPVVALQLGSRILVPLRVLFPFEIASVGLPLTDNDTFQGNDTFPRDFDRFVADDFGTDDEAAVSDRDFVGRRIVVGVEIR